MDLVDCGVVVTGAGTMGRGIAQLAAVQGHSVILHDVHPQTVEGARSALDALLKKLSDKKKPGYENPGKILSRITFQSGGCPDSSTLEKGPLLVIEAITEDLTLKSKLFEEICLKMGDDAILATNTSSLSVTALSRSVSHPERFLGIHFFNPAPVLPLVELVPTVFTNSALPIALQQLFKGWGKEPVLVKDTPGFIVNRVARPFYSEAIRMLEEGIADVPFIDAAMKHVGGFRMGPFELMDFIGNDVNFAVTEIVFQDFFYDSRFRPSLTQKRYVEAGLLGRKSGRGYYDYQAGEAPPQDPPEDMEVASAIFERIFIMLVNEAADALHFNVASRSDIEIAMQKGVNYPKGLFAWADEYGLTRILEALESLHYEYREERYRPHPLLRQLVKTGTTFGSL